MQRKTYASILLTWWIFYFSLSPKYPAQTSLISHETITWTETGNAHMFFSCGFALVKNYVWKTSNDFCLNLVNHSDSLLFCKLEEKNVKIKTFEFFCLFQRVSSCVPYWSFISLCVIWPGVPSAERCIWDSALTPHYLHIYVCQHALLGPSFEFHLNLCTCW